MIDIKRNLQSINNTAQPFGAKVVAVSKTHPTETIREAYHAGHRIFGENKVQEIVDKADELPKDIEWHMIGHLQTNKVKFIAAFVSLIHSVDSLKLLAEINKQGAKLDRTIPCLIQVHIAKEETKFGLEEHEVFQLLEEANRMTHAKIVGLMGMATNTDDDQQIRGEFKRLKSLFDKLRQSNLPHNAEMKELSMGMSSDYQMALDEGSTMIRVGSMIFGERQYI